MFQSTPSLRRATLLRRQSLPPSRFQSTPSLRRATDGTEECVGDSYVSIHALLAESDLLQHKYLYFFNAFQSTPSLRRATPGLFVPSFCRGFQSTPSLRRATPWPLQRRNGFRFQSTPSLRRATAPTVHVVNQSCKRGFAPTSRRRYITYRLLFIILGCQSAFSNVLQESPTSRQFDVSLGLAQRPCQTALK